MSNSERILELKMWMYRHNVTIRYVAEQLGVSETLARKYLVLSETVPTHWHNQLVQLGVPPEMLPRAEDKKRGPARKIPLLNPHSTISA